MKLDIILTFGLLLLNYSSTKYGPSVFSFLKKKKKRIVRTCQRRPVSVDLYKNRLALLIPFHSIDADVVKKTRFEIDQVHERR